MVSSAILALIALYGNPLNIFTVPFIAGGLESTFEPEMTSLWAYLFGVAVLSWFPLLFFKILVMCTNCCRGTSHSLWSWIEWHHRTFPMFMLNFVWFLVGLLPVSEDPKLRIIVSGYIYCTPLLFALQCIVWACLSVCNLKSKSKSE